MCFITLVKKTTLIVHLILCLSYPHISGHNIIIEYTLMVYSGLLGGHYLEYNSTSQNI